MVSKIKFGAIEEFTLAVHGGGTEAVVPENAMGQHFHKDCEIFVHLSGDVSFMVENSLYPIRYGNVVITRPDEYHHCVYHSKTRHRHYCMFFSGNVNEELFDIFYDRKKGEANLYSLSPENTERLVSICRTLNEQEVGAFERYYLFLEILHLLRESETTSREVADTHTPLAVILRRMHENYGEHLSTKELADEAHISVSTMERMFSDSIGTTPFVYLKNLRLSNAARLLAEGCTVTYAAEKCGFSDVSAMISQFKKRYGMTPLGYKKSVESSAVK